MSADLNSAIAELEMARDAYSSADPNDVDAFNAVLRRLDAARSAVRAARAEGPAPVSAPLDREGAEEGVRHDPAVLGEPSAEALRSGGEG